MAKPVTIKSRSAARALESATSRRVMFALIAQESSLTDLSQCLRLSLSLLTYHVKRLRRLNLVQIIGESRRAGRPQKRYRAVAEQFFVPSNLASRSAFGALAEELRTALEADRDRRKSAGTLYLIDDSGRRRVQPVAPSKAGGAFEAWISLPMSASEADNFGKDLRALISKYAVRKDSKAGQLLIHCAFARRKSR